MIPGSGRHVQYIHDTSCTGQFCLLLWLDVQRLYSNMSDEANKAAIKCQPVGLESILKRQVSSAKSLESCQEKATVSKCETTYPVINEGCLSIHEEAQSKTLSPIPGTFSRAPCYRISGHMRFMYPPWKRENCLYTIDICKTCKGLNEGTSLKASVAGPKAAQPQG